MSATATWRGRETVRFQEEFIQQYKSKGHDEGSSEKVRFSNVNHPLLEGHVELGDNRLKAPVRGNSEYNQNWHFCMNVNHVYCSCKEMYLIK